MTTMQNLDTFLMANTIVKEGSLEFDLNLIIAREACMKALRETADKDKTENKND